MAFLAGKYDSERKHRDRYAVRSGPHGIYRTACENYDVYYSVYQNGSWTTPVKNGSRLREPKGQGLRVEVSGNGDGKRCGRYRSAQMERALTRQDPMCCPDL